MSDQLTHAQYVSAMQVIASAIHAVFTLNSDLLDKIQTAAGDDPTVYANTREWTQSHDLMRALGLSADLARQASLYRPSMLSDKVQVARKALYAAQEERTRALALRRNRLSDRSIVQAHEDEVDRTHPYR
jgi:hypothetical protein